MFNARPAALLAALALTAPHATADEMPNACPIDGCRVSVLDAQRSGSELLLTFDANFQPDMARNHIHVWWGELYTVEQVSNNAETVHGVTQGDWEPTDAYPTFTTGGGVTAAKRGNATTLCVSAANRDHDILDVDAMHCVDVSSLL